MPRRRTGPRVRPFTIYLLKTRVRKATDAIETLDGIHALATQIGEVEATLFVKPSRIVPPAWVGFFADHVDLGTILLRSASSAAVLVVAVAGRWFAVTFGYGRHLLAPGIWEPNFGLKVTLNSIRDTSIRSIDRSTFDSIARHTREEATRAGSIEQFGINVEEDLLRAVVGNPESEKLGRRMAGMDALNVTAAVTLPELLHKLTLYHKQWSKLDYKARYPWVDHVAEIRDKRQIQRLDKQLAHRLARKELDQTWLAVPVPIDWSRVGGFRFSRSLNAATHEDIHIGEFLGSLRNSANLSPETLKRKSVYCLDPDGRHERDRWTIYNCLYSEIHHENDIFLLTGGRWYRVARRFVQKIDEDVERLPVTEYKLPLYKHGSEAEYNKAVARESSMVEVMDAKNIRYGGGASQIEFCDLLINQRTLLHVKRYSGSSVLSHLFSQGVVSATVFLQDQEFRREVRRVLGPTVWDAVPDARPDPSEYEIGFAIISRSAKDLVLPFFSKVNLRNAARTLKGFGYSVTLTKVGTESEDA